VEQTEFGETMSDRAGVDIGFVGLGHMGEPMVGRLLGAGRSVVGFDLDPAAAPGLDAVDGFSRARELRDLAVAPVVVLMLPSSDVVDSALVDGGLLAALAPGTTLIDMGSSVPGRTRDLAARAAEAGVEMLDAPVSGGVGGAVAGRLAIMVGGPTAAYERVLPLFEILGAKVALVGPAGSGHAIKALNNLMSATHLLVSSEALLAARAFGLDLKVVLDLVNGSSGRSGSTEQKWPKFVLDETYDSGFAMALMVKDMKIALELEDELGVRDDLGRRAVELWSRAVEELPEQADHTEIVRWLERGPDEVGTG
jgi:3-hydroxyisobutyrate dehydrogenase